MGNIFDESWRFPEIKKPTKPFQLDRPKQGLRSALTTDARDWADTQYNFLTEMFKMMPGYEQSEYLSDPSNIDAEAMEYGSNFGHVADARTSQGHGVGFGSIQGYAEDLDFHPGMTEFNHSLNGNFQTMETQSQAGLSPTLYSRINNRFDSDSRSFYQLVMDQNSTSLDSLSNEDAFLMLGALFESRSRVYIAMTTLFGDPNETDDTKRIQQINQWVNAQGQELSDDNKQAFLTFLGSFRAYFSRIKALMGMGTADIYSTLDQQKFSNFAETLQAKANTYIQSLSDMDPSKEEAQAVYNEWYAPDQDGTGWFEAKGKRVQKTGDIPGQLDDIFENINVLTNGQLTNRSSDKVQIQNASDGSALHLGKAYDEVWGVHAYGVLKYAQDHLVDMSVSAGARNREGVEKYTEEMAEYDQKVEEAKQQETDEKKAEERKRAQQEQERRKLEQNSQSRAQQFRAELQKTLQQQTQKAHKQQKQSIEQAQKSGQQAKAQIKKSIQSSQNKAKQQAKANQMAQQRAAQRRKGSAGKSKNASVSEQLQKMIMKRNQEQAQKNKKKSSI